MTETKNDARRPDQNNDVGRVTTDQHGNVTVNPATMGATAGATAPGVNVTIHAPAGRSTAGATAPGAIYRGRYAEEWFNDARREAAPQTVGDGQARRREIVFTACCAESYLNEWAMDHLEPAYQTVKAAKKVKRWGDEAPLMPWTPPTTTRWEVFSRRLASDPAIADVQQAMSFSGADNLRAEWDEVINLRNALVHADVSRIVMISPNDTGRPSPTPDVLAAIAPSWAVDILVRCIARLQEQTQTPQPSWIERAQKERP